ncbi:MAG: hypothetical protein Q8N84_01075, partial [bacterium]|nr:hypothetical protein [bacterium]
VKAPAYGGQYEVRLALENPYEGPHQGETWGIITDKSGDAKFRYLLGEIQVSGRSSPPPGRIDLGQSRIGLGRNVIFWDQEAITFTRLWEQFPGTVWLSQIINGFWQSAVREFGGALGSIPTNTNFTITKSLTTNTL